MMQYTNRTDDIYKEIYNLKILHGGLAAWIATEKFNKIPKISKDIKVVVVTNYHTYPILRQYENSPDNISLQTILLPTFRCWLDKIEPVLNYIQTISEPYILYVDATDTIFVDDILDPKKILDTYNCKILFNAEDGMGQPGHPCDPKLWLYKDYYSQNRIDEVHLLKKRLFNRTQILFSRSLNAGVYLGEREYIISCLKNILSLMLEDSSKKYPYGESDDQILWQHLMAKDDLEQIQIDYNNLFFFRGGVQHLDFPISHWEHFNYFNKNSKYNTE
jgi:hypothetical protein